MPVDKFLIVGIGASAGGIEALHSFFEHMPSDCGMAFVVLLHLPRQHKSMLTEILERWTPMRVLQCTDGLLLEQNCVYVAPPHTFVTLADEHLVIQIQPEDPDRFFRPIDAFFDSLSAVLRERAVGIVLSGTGSDGALGLKAIKEAGGLTIAQGSNGTAPQYHEMPNAAIATGVVDLIAPIEEIPGHLIRMKAGTGGLLSAEGSAGEADAAKREICEILRAQLGHDFSGYRTQTFLRRVGRRMQVVNAAGLQDYLTRLRADQDEVTLLFRDLLIRVTSFFRDTQTFTTLEAKVIPGLFEGKMADDAVRIWVPGCATGEEAYSLAILLREHMDGLKGTPTVQVFATDIDDTAIATARLGRYPTTLLEGLSEERRKRFFALVQGSYVVTKEIRDLCIFSTHNLVRDPPFSRMDLVSCRNLLIYMNTDLQAKVIPAFHYSLVPGGILLLGGSESAARHQDLFELVDKPARIFRRCDTQSPYFHNLQMDAALRSARSPEVSTRSPPPRNLGSNPLFDRRTQQSNEPSRDHEDGSTVLLAFDELLEPLVPSADSILRLQEALRSARERLLSLEEEHQTALEELRSSNEELHSVNEELQSTNEELETSKEELQSLNEELHTVNSRLTEKIEEVDQSNSDLRNLFNSIDVATAFLDRNLIIRSFTPAITSIYNLIPSDAGRPLADIVSRLDYRTLREDVAHVLATLGPLERRVAREDRSAHYLMRISPYREPDSTVSGVLITFVDVTGIVKAEEALIEADVRKDVFLATLSHELRNPLAPIRTAAQLLQSTKLGEEDRIHAQTIIARQVSHLGSLLDDLLDVSRITRGKFLLKKEYVDLQTLIAAAVEAVQPRIDAKEHTLRVEYPQDPILLEVDPVRMTQVFTNLLTNAAKYTQKGGLISMGARLDAQNLIIFVRDNGAGIAPEMITKIFKMFARVPSDVDSGEGGLGVGLALSKGLVELHGGRIEVRSAGLKQGSEFSVLLSRSLIVDTPAQTARRPGNGEDFAISRRVLVADDNRDAADSLSMILKLAGHEVYLAHTGREAFEIAKRVRPDVGVLDIGMPEWGGYEVAERIRHEAWGEHMILIAVTGWGQEGDKRHALAAGFDHHLTKPVDAKQLERMFNAEAPSARPEP